MTTCGECGGSTWDTPPSSGDPRGEPCHVCYGTGLEPEPSYCGDCGAEVPAGWGKSQYDTECPPGSPCLAPPNSCSARRVHPLSTDFYLTCALPEDHEGDHASIDEVRWSDDSKYAMGANVRSVASVTAPDPRTAERVRLLREAATACSHDNSPYNVALLNWAVENTVAALISASAP